MSDFGGPRFLPQIESLRGFAALSVAFAHCGMVPHLYEQPSPNVINSAFARLFIPFDYLINARAAVVVFFVVSGLVLSLSLDRKPAHRSLFGFGGFLGRRMLRLYPAHLFALLLFVPLAGLTIFQMPIHGPARIEVPGATLIHWAGRSVYGDFQTFQFLATAALWSNWYNPPVWTLAIEVVAALCLPLFAAWSRAARLGPDLAIVAFLFGAGVWLDSAPLIPVLFVYLPAFYLGCMVRTHGRRLAAAASGRAPGPAMLLACSLLLLVGPEAIVGPSTGHQLVVMLMSVAAFGVVAAVAWTSGPIIKAMLLNTAARALGRLSYSFYLWHGLVLFALVRLELAMVPEAAFARWDHVLKALTFLVSTGVALAIAALSYRWIERPFIALGRRIGPPAAPLPAAALEAARSR